MKMNKIKIIFFVIFLSFPYFLLSETLNYVFKEDVPVSYKFKIAGDISFGYNQAEKNNFNVLATGNIDIKTIKTNNSYTLEIIPRKTLIKVNDMVIEDITKRETEISNVVSTSRIEMQKNGKIIKTEEIEPNIINIGNFLSLLPVFPEGKMYKGRTWQQKISSFEIPGFLKMCNLDFKYFISDIKEERYTIKLISNNIIDEKEVDKDITIKFKGTNNSNGNFVFNGSKGKLEKFNGNFKLNLKLFFLLPGTPGENTTNQSLPMDLKINLSISLE